MEGSSGEGWETRWMVERREVWEQMHKIAKQMLTKWEANQQWHVVDNQVRIDRLEQYKDLLD